MATIVLRQLEFLSNLNGSIWSETFQSASFCWIVKCFSSNKMLQWIKMNRPRELVPLLNLNLSAIHKVLSCCQCFECSLWLCCPQCKCSMSISQTFISVAKHWDASLESRCQQRRMSSNICHQCSCLIECMLSLLPNVLMYRIEMLCLIFSNE